SSRTSSNVTNHGINNEGNHWCTREAGSNDVNSNPYHYSNRDGSYYYSNSNIDQGSRYFNNGKGGAWYTPPPK
ncbi:hypothetical protein COCSADRAFT_196874, partial [Bipolaris sorokiniana ND90Pr]